MCEVTIKLERGGNLYSSVIDKGKTVTLKVQHLEATLFYIRVENSNSSFYDI